VAIVRSKSAASGLAGAGVADRLARPRQVVFHLLSRAVPRRGFPDGWASPTMPSSPAGRYPHCDCTSDKTPAGDVSSGSGPGGGRVHRGNSCRRVLPPEVQSRCGYPAARCQPHSRSRGIALVLVCWRGRSRTRGWAQWTSP